MSLETDLYALLQAECPRFFPDVAPNQIATPYGTWQHLGGEALRYGDNTAPDKRNTLTQVSVWSTTRAEALSISRDIAESLCASSDLVATPEGEAQTTYEPDTQLYGCIQRFSIWASR